MDKNLIYSIYIMFLLVPVSLGYLVIKKVFKKNFNSDHEYIGSLIWLRFLSIIFNGLVFFAATTAIYWLGEGSNFDKVMVYIFCPPFMLYSFTLITLSFILPARRFINLMAWLFREGQNLTIF